jgi:translation initiation factor IF-2
LRQGDIFLAGTAWGRVRAMQSARGESLTEVGPSTPVLLIGFDSLPEAGDQFVVVKDERTAREVADQRRHRMRIRQDTPSRPMTLEDLQQRLVSGEQNELNVVLKSDVQGSADALKGELSKLGNAEVRVNVVHAAVGGINESDVLLASASKAIIIGFHVTANARVKALAEQEGIDIRTYRIIYEVTDDLKKALEGMLAPDTKEVITGHAEVRQVFRSSAVGNIAGCHVLDGEITRGSQVRILRNDIVVHESAVGTLKRNKDDARVVASGFECGIKVDNYEDVKAGDILETFRLDKVAKKLV